MTFDDVRELSSSYMPTLLMVVKRKMHFKKTLNNNGTKIEPCGKPAKISV